MPATQHFQDWVERRGQQLRRRLSLAPLAPLDPYQLAPRLGAQVISPRDIQGLSAEDGDHLLIADADSWSAGSVRLPNGLVVIVLNPTHPLTNWTAHLWSYGGIQERMRLVKSPSAWRWRRRVL